MKVLRLILGIAFIASGGLLIYFGFNSLFGGKDPFTLFLMGITFCFGGWLVLLGDKISQILREIFDVFYELIKAKLKNSRINRLFFAFSMAILMCRSSTSYCEMSR